MSTCFPVGWSRSLLSPAKQGSACGSTFLPVLGFVGCCFWKATLLWSEFVAPWLIIRLSVSSHTRVHIYWPFLFPSHSWACLCLLSVSCSFSFFIGILHIFSIMILCELCFTNSVSDWSWSFPFSSGDFTEQKPLLLLNFVNFVFMICAFLTHLKRALRCYLLFCKKKASKFCFSNFTSWSAWNWFLCMVWDRSPFSFMGNPSGLQSWSTMCLS